MAGAPKQRAGYVKSYAVNNFTFATVQGAGHLVPTYKPKFGADRESNAGSSQRARALHSRLM